MKRMEIGYLCRKGHFCFHKGDPEEFGQCEPGVGRIYVEYDPEDWPSEQVSEIIQEADVSMARKYEAWRAS